MDLAVSQLGKIYLDADRKLTIIESLTHKFQAGRAVAIVGRSGVGKSTLLHLLGGLDRPTKGEVTLGDKKFSDLGGDELAAFRGRNVGFVFQSHHLLPEFEAVENVMMPLIVNGASRFEAANRANSLLERVGLSNRAHHRPGQLSGGEQQRVAIARALAMEPALVLADEPTGSLDQETAADIQDLLLRVCREGKKTLIVVTHNPELASSMDQVLEMVAGGGLQAWQRN